MNNYRNLLFKDLEFTLVDYDDNHKSIGIKIKLWVFWGKVKYLKYIGNVKLISKKEIKLANIDIVQEYKNKIWEELIEFFENKFKSRQYKNFYFCWKGLPKILEFKKYN